MQFKKRRVLLLGAMALVSADAVFAQTVVKIGHVGPISGPNALFGRESENGAKMAIDELNARGPKIGDTTVKFELVTEDDASDPKQGTTVAQKLVDAKINAVVGHFDSGTTIPASKIYFEAGIPQISPAATHTKYTQQGFTSAFRLVATDGQLGGTLGRYAVQVSKAKKIAVIDDRTAYGQGVVEEFVKGVKSKKTSGAEIVAQQFTNDKATDFSAILTAIKDKSPDLIFFGGMAAVGGPLLKQMKELGINARFMGGSGICTDELAKLAGNGMSDDQVVCAEAGGVEESGKKALGDFKAAFKKKFNADAQICAPYSYDAVMVFAEAMKKANSADPAKYLPFLAKTNYKGVSGPIAFDTKGDIRDGTLTLYTFRGGKRVPLTVTK